MALQLILGNSGAGKSYYIFQKIIKASMEHPEKQYLIIVPEQFTMQTQKDLVMMHPRHGIMNIDVLSFERLAHRVFHEVGGEHRKILEDTGKNLILRRLAEEKKEELTLLGKNLKRLGYISEIKSLISEFTQYRITKEQLSALIEQNQKNPQLQFKLKDLKLIYESFQEYLKDTYLTAEELLGALSESVEESAAIKDSVIVLDGYTGFTPVQLGLLRKLLILSEEIYVAILEVSATPESTFTTLMPFASQDSKAGCTEAASTGFKNKTSIPCVIISSIASFCFVWSFFPSTSINISPFPSITALNSSRMAIWNGFVRSIQV